MALAKTEEKSAVESKINWLGLVMVLVGFIPSGWVEIKEFITNYAEIIISVIGGIIVIVRSFFTKKEVTSVLPK